MAPIQDPPMPKYRCHKIVSALKIRDVELMPAGAVLYPEDERFAPVHVSETFYNTKIPAMIGPVREGYFVVYDDGYESWSPRAVFEAGYTRIE